MRHQVPADVRGKEKIIAGLLDIYQTLWIVCPLIIGAVVLLALFKILGLFSFVIVIPIWVSGIPFALYKKEELSLFEYLKLKYQAKKKVSILIKYTQNPEEDHIR